MMDNDFKARLDAITSSSEQRSDRYLAILKKSDDLTSSILKGHLVAEELLTTGIEASCANVDHLKKANLRFIQKVSMFRALERIPVMPDAYWDAIGRLNRLRNELAHNLDDQGVPKLSADFVRAVKRGSLGENKEFPKPDESQEALIQALHFLLGGLEVLALWQQMISELATQKLLGDSSAA